MPAVRPKCRGCKRPLKRPSPSGYGPVCARRLGLTATTSTGPASPAAATSVPPVPGQCELPLAEQPDLWGV